MNESNLARSAAEHASDHAGAQYVNFVMTVAWKTFCSDASGILWQRRILRAHKILLHDARTLVTWSAADNWSLTMTPRTLRLLTRSMFIYGGSRSAELPRLSRAAKMISFYLEQFSFKLFVAAHAWMRVICCSRELESTVGTTKYVSSANLKMRLPVVSGRRSAAETIYEAGPRLEPWMTLTLISATNEHLPAYLVDSYSDTDH